MMRKLLAVIIAVFALLSLAFGVAGCGEFDPEYILETYINANGELIIVLADGTEYNYGKVKDNRPFDGKSIKDAHIDENGDLWIEFEDGSTHREENFLDDSLGYNDKYLYTEVMEGENLVGYAFRGIYTETALNITIPSRFRGLPVVEIMDSAFYMNDRLISVTIPDSIKKIGAYAFEECTALVQVNFGNGLTEIGDSAFGGCSALTEIVLPNSIEKIGPSAFVLCSALNKVELPMNGNLKVIDEGAFAGCSSLESFIMPDTVTNMGYAAFMQCSKLSNMALSDNLTEISEYAFSQCSALKTLTFGVGSKVKKIGYAAFDRSGLEEIVIPAGVTDIDASAFYMCKSLTSVTLNEKLVNIGGDFRGGAFQACSALEEITIPASVKFIGQNAFSGCSKLKSVVIERYEGWVYSEEENSGPFKALSAVDLSNPEKAAKYLVDEYRKYFWRCP